MSQQQQLIADLKNSRESAQAALYEIYAKIAKCKDNERTKSSISYNAVHAICMAVKDGRSYELYSEGIKNLVPNILDHHWNMYVELLRYILGEFYSKNYFKHTSSLAFTAKVDRIMTPADVKSHLKLYSRQLCYGHTYMIEEDLIKMIACISELLTKCKEMQFEDLLEDFYINFFGFPALMQNAVTKHLTKMSSIFDKYFSAIGAYKIPKEKLNSQFTLLTKTLINLIQLDVADRNSVLSQNFLKACKENASLKEYKYQSYAFNLFYCLVKLLLFPNALDFNRNLLDTLRKFSSFFDRSEFIGDSWFMDTIVTFTRLLDSHKTQKAFFQAMDEESLVEAFALIEKLLKLAHGINYECGLWICCNSVRKHVIFRLCQVEMVMYEAAVAQGFNKPELNAGVYTILKHALNVADFFKCSTGTYEIGSILSVLARCSQNVENKEHCEHIAKLLELSAKAKAYMPSNYMRNLLKCLMHVHKVSGSTQAQSEACALYITHILAANEDMESIKKYIGMFFSIEPCMSILETVDLSTSPLKVNRFDRRFLHLLETSVYSKMRDHNILIITSLLKSAETTIDFVLIARQYSTSNLSLKLDRMYTEIKEKPTPNPTDHLALGHICKIRAVQQMDEVKNLFSVPKVTEGSLSQIHDPSKLKRMDLTNEIRIVKLAMEGIESFQKFFEFAPRQSLSDERFFVDWEAIVDDIALLARLFHFRGFLDYAYISWRFLLHVTTYLDDILNQIRALSFICRECEFVEHYDPQFDFDAEITRRDKGIYENLTSMEFLTPRKQNYVLVCLCNIAWYYARSNRFAESDLLLDLASKKVDELVEREKKFELVRATLLSVIFRIQWKLRLGLSSRKAFTLVDKILDEIRAAVYFTSEDSLNFPILLFDMVNDITEFTTNRLCEPSTVPYVQMVLKLALDAGAAYRFVQFLIVWTHINLQSENVVHCQVKLDVIDTLYRNSQSPRSKLKGNSNGKVKGCINTTFLESCQIYEDEPVRKAAYVNPVSPVRMKYKPPSNHRDVDSFLISHDANCECDKCSHTFLSWQLFRVGCLNARLLYLGDIYSGLEKFYKKAKEWCKKTIHNTPTRFHFRDYELYMLIQHLNVQRRLGYYDATPSTSKACKDVTEKFKKSLDVALGINLAIQMESVVAESRKSTSHLNAPARRLLKFSPTGQQNSAQPPAPKGRENSKKKSPISSDDIKNLIFKDPPTTPMTQKIRPRTTARSLRRKGKSPEFTVNEKRTPFSRSIKQTLNNTILVVENDNDSPTSKDEHETAIEEICKTVEKIQLSKPPRKKTVLTRKTARPNLNNAMVVIEDEDDSPGSTASKTENTPRTRGRLKKWPTVDHVETMDVRTQSQLRRRI